MQDINMCQTCLSTDRLLVNASKYRMILKRINYEELDNKMICWECQSNILKFFRFKVQARLAEFSLKGKLQDHKSLSKLLYSTKHEYDFEFRYCDQFTTTSTDTDTEQKLIKQEIFVQETIEYPTVEYSSDDEKRLLDFVVKKDAALKKQKISKTTEAVNNEDKSSNISKKTKTLKQFTQKISELETVELKGKFKTVVYTEEEMLRSREEKRNQPNYKKIPYKCNMCVLGFIKKDYYDLHLIKKHDETIGTHMCDVCLTRFRSNASLQRHRSTHYLHYTCTLCDYKTSLEKAAINHCRVKHENDEINRIHCKQCTAVLRTHEELSEHTRTEHTLYCHECGEKFKGKHTLKAHLTRIHAIKREFVCDICNRSFLTKSRLESHMTHHSGALALRLSYCSQCKIQYRDIHVYRDHLRNSKYHAVDRYSCSECHKKFASKVYWTKHYNFYHLKKSKHKCEACNKLFISKWKLKTHKELRHGLSRTRKHACNECGKNFYTLPTLRSHQLIHSEQRQYMCEDCGDTFKQPASLYTHARLVHKGGKRKKKLP